MRRIATRLLAALALCAACEPADPSALPDGAAVDAATGEAGAAPIDARGDATGPDAPDLGAPLAPAGCLAAVDTALLRRTVAELSGETAVLLDGKMVTLGERQTAAGRAGARAYLRQAFEGIGFRAREHAYATGVNLAFERVGSSGRTVILSAHYDTVVGSAGADDDATGLAAALAVGQALAGCTLAHGVRVVAFDEEEKGLVGSRAYAAALTDRAQVIGAFQLEMLGWDSDDDGRFNLVDCSPMLNRELVAGLAEEAAAVGLRPVPYCTFRSDHKSLLDVGVPALCLSQQFFPAAKEAKGDANPCYHQSCDRSDRINLRYLEKMTTLVARQAARLVGAR